MQYGRTSSGALDIRQRPFPRMGFVVDGGIAGQINAEFHPFNPGLDVATLDSESGIELVFVRRNRSHAVTYDVGSPAPVEFLTKLQVQQILLVSHRLLIDTTAPLSSKRNDALTFAVVHEHACTRLLTAAFDRAEAHKNVEGVFLRDDAHEIEHSLATELHAARKAGHCVAAIEATTLRTDLASTTSEKALAEILLSVPDAVSPLSACYCRQQDNEFNKR